MESVIIVLCVLVVVLIAAVCVISMRNKGGMSDGVRQANEQRLAEVREAYERQIADLKHDRENQIAEINRNSRLLAQQAEDASQQRLEQLKESLGERIRMLEGLLAAKDKEIAELKAEHEQRMKALAEAHDGKTAELTGYYDKLLGQVRESSLKQIAQLKENNDAQLKKIQELNARQVEDQLSLIREQMKTTSEEVLKKRQDELGEENLEQVSKIINPLMESLKGMKESFDISKEKQKEAMTRLDETIRLNTLRSESLGETADRLARALTGQVKAQGNFGELKLKQLLENMELREGEQYDTQETLKDTFGRRITGDDGKGLVPDFILHFPNNRHVVIDAKMSLTAYERYMNADEGSNDRDEALTAHIASIRNNVARLAKKSYFRYLPEGYNRLDFAFMYVPVDAALNLALLNDSSLWKEAYDQGVIILGPQTMYMNLRVLEMMWTQVRQLENQQTMIDCANLIIDRVQDFATRFKEVDTSMHTVIDKLNKFKISAAPSGKSIITAARALVKSGGQENKNKVSLTKVETLFVEDGADNSTDTADRLIE